MKLLLLVIQVSLTYVSSSFHSNDWKAFFQFYLFNFSHKITQTNCDKRIFSVQTKSLNSMRSDGWIIQLIFFQSKKMFIIISKRPFDHPSNRHLLCIILKTDARNVWTRLTHNRRKIHLCEQTVFSTFGMNRIMLAWLLSSKPKLTKQKIRVKVDCLCLIFKLRAVEKVLDKTYKRRILVVGNDLFLFFSN